MISISDKHFAYYPAPSDPNVRGQMLDINSTGPNQVWGSEWRVSDFEGAVAGRTGFIADRAAETLVAGDYIVLVDPAMGLDRAEFTKVAHVDGSKVYVDQPLTDSFPSGYVAKIPADRVVSNLRLENWQIEEGEGGTGLWAMFVDGLSLHNVWAGRCSASAMRFDFCRNIRATKCQVWDDQPRTERGRGFDFYNCNRVKIEGASGTGCRHAFHFTNAREVDLSKLSTMGSQDASIDFHGRNSSGMVRDSRVDGCVKVGNPSYPRGMDTIELVDVHTASWYQVHGGCKMKLVGCSGKNVLMAGYPGVEAPEVTLKRCKIVLPDGPSTQAGPVVCFNITGTHRKFFARMEGCEIRSEIQGRWTREIYVENAVPGSELVLIETPAERVQVVGTYNPIRVRAA